MSSYPIEYEADYSEHHNRVTTLFRMIMVIPIAIYAMVVGIIAEFALVISWFVLVFTGRYPEGLYRFICGVMRLDARMRSYYFLLTDSYPPFSLAEEDDYPVKLKIGPAKDHYSRLKVLFRIIIAIPLMILVYLISIWAELIAIASWFVILVTGKQPRGLYEQLVFSLRFLMRANGYILLVTETYPPISDENQGSPAHTGHTGVAAT